MKKIIIVFLISLGLISCQKEIEEKINIGGYIKSNDIKNFSLEGEKMTIYKSPTCGCCMGHAQALMEEGVEFEIVEDIKILNQIRDQYGLPIQKQSCHTIITENGYVIEGHVPVYGIKKLLKEKPDITGVTLPGMPIGTPGMPGEKIEDYVIETFKDGTFGDFLSL